jgi:hypothetical protein
LRFPIHGRARHKKTALNCKYAFLPYERLMAARRVADEGFFHHRSTPKVSRTEGDQRGGSRLADLTENVTGESVIDIPLLKNDW